MQTQAKNGNGKSRDLTALYAKLEELRPPGTIGRPSNEVIQIRAEIARLEKLHGTNGTNGKGKKATTSSKPEVIFEAPPPVEPAKSRRKPVKAKTKAEDEKPERREIYIPPIVQEAIEVEVVGLTDLIQHAWDKKTIREIEENQQRTVGRSKGDKPLKAPRVPRDEWNSARYVNEDGEDCAPAVQFKKCMVSAASRIPGVTMKDINTAVFVKGTDDPSLVILKFDGKEPIMRTDMVKIGKFPNKTAQPRYRPAYRNWKAKLRIEFDTSVISAEQVVNLLNRGGFGVGIAEWRPEKGGEFGRFRVANVKALKN